MQDGAEHEARYKPLDYHHRNTFRYHFSDKFMIHTCLLSGAHTLPEYISYKCPAEEGKKKAGHHYNDI